MATPEPERPALRPSYIAGRGFPLTRKGYEVEGVHAFLREVAEYVSRLQGEVEWLRARSEHLERRSAAAQEAAYGRLSRDFMEVVRRTDEAAGRVRLQAEAKAQSEMATARKDAGRILGEARLEAERIIAAARLEANEIDWQAMQKGGHLAWQPEPDAPGPSDASGVDLPTVSVDIAGIWDRDDVSWGQEESGPVPQLFEEPAHRAPQIPELWKTNGQLSAGEARGGVASDPGDADDLDVYLDVSIFDLFDEPED
ncbi:MAG: DivIVA domain-containing protein [Actinomycetota bacterium]